MINGKLIKFLTGLVSLLMGYKICLADGKIYGRFYLLCISFIKEKRFGPAGMISRKFYQDNQVSGLLVSNKNSPILIEN